MLNNTFFLSRTINDISVQKRVVALTAAKTVFFEQNFVENYFCSNLLRPDNDNAKSNVTGCVSSSDLGRNRHSRELYIF